MKARTLFYILCVAMVSISTIGCGNMYRKIQSVTDPLPLPFKLPDKPPSVTAAARVEVRSSIIEGMHRVVYVKGIQPGVNVCLKGAQTPCQTADNEGKITFILPKQYASGTTLTIGGKSFRVSPSRAANDYRYENGKLINEFSEFQKKLAKKR